MRKFLLMTFLLVGTWTTAWTQEAVKANEAFGLLRISRDPAVAGMAGGGYSVVSRSAAFATFDNPAIMTFALSKVDVAVSYGMLTPSFSKAMGLSGGAAVKLGKLAVSAGYCHQKNASYDLGEGPYTPTDMIVGGAVSIPFGQAVSVGASVRYVSQKLYTDYAVSGMSVSLMALYHGKGFNVTAGLSDFGGKVKMGSGTSSLPTSVKVAADYNGLSFGEDHGLLFALDGDYYFSGNYSAAVSARYAFREMVFVRAAYRYSSPRAVLPSHLALGLGGKLFGVTLDVSYVLLSEPLSGTLCAGLGYRF